MGFDSLQHIKDRRSTCHGLCLPATFRLQGLVTLLTVSSLRARAGPISYRRRSWDSPFGVFPSRSVPGRYHPRGPTYRFFHRRARCEAPNWIAGPRFLGFCHPASPWRRTMGLARSPLDTPLGFPLLGYTRKDLGPIFTRPSSHTLPPRMSEPIRRAAPRSIDRPLPDSSLARHRSLARAKSNPSRVLAPAQSHSFAFPATRAMYSPRVASRITVD
jgi:hypothetical protein